MKIMAIIQVESLTKEYRKYIKQPGLWNAVKGLVYREYETVRAVREISFAIEEGELVGFLGPNGAGKTTTLKMLSGLIYPTSGKARVMGFVPWQRRNEFRRNFGLVMGQKNQLWWDLPATESLLLNKELYGVSDRDYKKIPFCILRALFISTSQRSVSTSSLRRASANSSRNTTSTRAIRSSSPVITWTISARFVIA